MVYNATEYAKGEYAGIGIQWIPGSNVLACTECGACKKKCPHQIREQLKESHNVLFTKQEHWQHSNVRN